MRVDRRDGVCRECGGPLDIIDADDATMTVECSECGEDYNVETDGLNDGGIHYLPMFLAERMERRTE